MTPRIRVLIVDDSAFARKVLREILSAVPEIEVVGTARDGLDALEKVEELRPDVMTLDLVMPNLDGVGVLTALPQLDRPRVLVVSISDADTDLGAAALQAGAIDIVKKPTALATDQFYTLRDELVSKVTLAATASSYQLGPAPRAGNLNLVAHHDVIVIGTSTGGPQAITRLLAELPANLPVPVLIALHIPAGYTEALAQRLNVSSPLDVVEAQDGLELRAGQAVLARGGSHMRIVKRLGRSVVQVEEEPTLGSLAPSVDALFDSAAREFGARTLGVVLTGMGNDGTSGCAAIRKAGGAVITEAAESCVVYGMPRSVYEAGLADWQAPLEKMAAEILRRL